MTTDVHWYIDTPAPVCISGNGDDLEVPSAQHFEILAAASQNLAVLEGHYVSLKGEFMHTQIPHYHAYPIFQIASIRRQHGP
jgi:hypothetical protein